MKSKDLYLWKKIQNFFGMIKVELGVEIIKY